MSIAQRLEAIFVSGYICRMQCNVCSPKQFTFELIEGFRQRALSVILVDYYSAKDKHWIVAVYHRKVMIAGLIQEQDLHCVRHPPAGRG